MPKRLLKKTGHIADSLFGLYYVFYWWDGFWFWNVLGFYVVVLPLKKTAAFSRWLFWFDCSRPLPQLLWLLRSILEWFLDFSSKFSQVFTWRFCFIFPPMFWFWEWQVYVKITGEDMWFNFSPSGGVGPRSKLHWISGRALKIPLEKGHKLNCCGACLTCECFSRWWQLDYFLFSPRTLGKMNPFWRAYFSDGLKPPTSWSMFCVNVFAWGVLPATSTTTNPGRLTKSRATSFGQDPWHV